MVLRQDDEITFLRERVSGRRPTVTILLGDSNIGKSTILEVLATRACADGHVVGRYECAVEGTDPLLKSLDDACQQLQGDWAVLLGEAGQEVLRTLTLRNHDPGRFPQDL
jgi:AAA+ ATPase superfamily predicted ATPase